MRAPRKRSGRRRCPTGKLRYHDLAEAKDNRTLLLAAVRAGVLPDTGKLPVRPYQCSRCGGWHLTSQVEATRVRPRATGRGQRRPTGPRPGKKPSPQVFSFLQPDGAEVWRATFD